VLLLTSQLIRADLPVNEAILFGGRNVMDD